MSVRTGNTPTPDLTWSAFTPIASSGGDIPGNSRYVQYRAVLSTTDPNLTPTLNDVTVNGAGDIPPSAVNDTKTVAQDSGATSIDVLANDTDPDGGPKTIASASDPAHGTVAVAGDNLSLTYTPDPNYCNTAPPTSTDDFTYTLNGGSTATVAVTVTCVVDQPPVAVNDTKTVAEDSAPPLLPNRDFEVDTSGWGSSNAAISRSTAEQHGGAASMQVDLNGTAWAQAFTNPYTAADPNTAYTVGMWVKAPLGYHYSFGAVALDASNAYISTFIGQAGTGTGTWQHVTASGTTPPGTASIAVYIGDPSGVAQTIYVDDVDLQTAAPTPIDVLANDNDGGDGGPFRIDSVTQPAHGTVTVAADSKSLSYQPNAGYCNDGSPTDDFTYTLNGGSTATVAVTVTCVVDNPPVAVNDTKTVAEDSAPPLLPNRDFEVDTSGWGSSNAAISRSTAEQHGGAASMQVDLNGTAWAQAFTNPLHRRRPEYRLHRGDVGEGTARLSLLLRRRCS